jgi:hypothetical protein
VEQSETKFKKRVLKDLKTLKNAWFFKSQEVCVRGIPDIILCLCGYFIALELKRDSKANITKLQWYNAEQISSKAWGIALIASPECWEEMFEYLKRIDGGEKPRRIVLKKLSRS